MDKQKQLEEMAEVINLMGERNAHYYDENLQECEAFADCNNIAEALYNAGYRKQSEVVKEIFEEITNSLLSLVYLGADGKWHTQKKYASKLHSFVEDYLKLKEKYTQELVG